MATKHDTTARRIANKKGASYNRGKGPDIKTTRQVIEVETVNSIKDGARQLHRYRQSVYVAGADDAATKAAFEHYQGTTIGVMDPSGKIVRRSTRQKSS